MAYSLNTLIHILEQDQHHLLFDTKPQFETLLEKARVLRDLVAGNAHFASTSGVEDLWSRIRCVTYRAEDIIESHIRDRVLSVLGDGTFELDLTDIMEEFDTLKEEISKIQTDPDVVSSEPDVVSEPGGVSDPGPDTNMVGLAEEFHQLLDQLTGHGPRLRIIPIVGMAGIGKTTLARQLYHHPTTVQHFEARLWITISQQSRCDDSKLVDYIRSFSMGRRYLIIVDDIWDVDAWDKINGAFLSSNNGSRVILTTRVGAVASHASHSGSYYHMRFLNADESWELFHFNVFGIASFPAELVEIGKKIASRCQGLPLAIILLARLLCKMELNLETWEHFVMNVNSMGVLDSALDVLSRSYSHLPFNLKPCFLYVGAFLGGHEIRVSRIIKLWIAEGFVKQIRGKSLEDTAEEYLKILIFENLLLVCQKESDGRIRTFKIHFILGKLCEEKAFEEKFLWLKHFADNNVPEDEDHLRRVSVHPLIQHSKKVELGSLVRSFVCVGPCSRSLASLFLGFSLLRVLDVFQLEFLNFSNFPRNYCSYSS